MPATLTRQIREQLEWEQLVAMGGKKGVHRPVGDQVTTPGGCVYLIVEGMARWAHTGQSARHQPLGANS